MLMDMNRYFSFLLGGRSDWHLTAPWIRAPKLSQHLLGPLAVVLSTVVGWLAFTGTNGLDQASTFSMWFGASSIVLMAWSFILALRVSFFERFWGGLDSMYRGHRWAGALAIPAMFLHTQIEPETKGAQLIAGASGNVADAAEELAETGELMLYPYRWWRWTHKLFGLPFAFASWHFYTAQKPYDNASGWGLWFAGFMLAGLVAWIARIVVRDAVAQGKSYTVVDVEHEGSLTRVELAPTGRPLDFDPGQFAFLRFEAKGMREPHPFSNELGPNDPVPTVLYACKSNVGDPLVDLLRTAATEGRIHLHLYPSGSRLTAEVLDELFADGMANHHVALCGPAGLVRDMAMAAHDSGARSIETEDFDIRQGFGPDRSREIDAATRKRLSARKAIAPSA